MNSGIFICYRRDDSAGHAGRLFDHLARGLGRDRVFMDIDGIPAGADFVKEIETRVVGCDTLLAVIGPEWLLPPPGEKVPRLLRDQDYVRMEIARALAYGRRVIPVLVNGGKLPRGDRLPADIADLLRRNAFTVHDDSFRDGVARLMAAIDPEAAHRYRASIERQAVAEAAPVTGGAPDAPRADAGRRRWLRYAALAPVAAGAAITAPWLARRRRQARTEVPRPGPDPVAVARRGQLEPRVHGLVRRYKDELLTRFGGDGWGRVEVNVPGRDPWVQAQALAALSGVPGSPVMFESMLRQPLKVLLEGRRPNGWNSGDFHRYFHVEPVLWTGMAFARLQRTPLRSELASHRRWFADMANRYRRGPVWHEFPVKIHSRPSIYATALALLMQLDAWEAAEPGPDDLRRQIAQTGQWLASQAHLEAGELRGWQAEVGGHDVSVGTSLLAAYALSRAQSQLGIDCGLPLGSQVPKLLARLGNVSFDQNDGYYFIGGRHPTLINHHVRITWSPWALGLALEWLRGRASTGSPEDAAAVLQVCDRLLDAADRQKVQSTYIFLLAEHLYVLARTPRDGVLTGAGDAASATTSRTAVRSTSSTWPGP